MIAHANSCYLAGRTGHPKGPSSSYAKMYGEKRKPDVITESGVKPGKTNQVAEWVFSLGLLAFTAFTASSHLLLLDGAWARRGTNEAGFPARDVRQNETSNRKHKTMNSNVSW